MRTYDVWPELKPDEPRIIYWIPTSTAYPCVFTLALNEADGDIVADYNGWHNGKLLHMKKGFKINIGQNLIVQQETP